MVIITLCLQIAHQVTACHKHLENVLTVELRVPPAAHQLRFTEFGLSANTASVCVVSSQPAHILDTKEEMTGGVSTMRYRGAELDRMGSSDHTWAALPASPGNRGLQSPALPATCSGPGFPVVFPVSCVGVQTHTW